MTKWPYPSKSGPQIYEVVLADDGRIVCNCRGWLIKRPNKPRQCSHIEDVVKKNNFTTEVQGEFLYVIANDLELPLQPAVVDYAEQYHTAHADGFVQPMLASALTKRAKDEPWEITFKPFQDGNHISQVKYDGERVIMAKAGGKILAWSRPKDAAVGIPRPVPPHIREFALKYLPDGTFDGEDIVGYGGKSYDVKRIGSEHLKQYVFFDILKVMGQDICGLQQQERRQLLEEALKNCTDETPIVLAPQYEPSADHLLALWNKGAEGVIVKRLTSTYRPGWRSPDWVKFKMEGYVTCTLTGYEAAKNGPYSKMKGMSSEGIEVSCKTRDNAMIRMFEREPDKYLGWRFVLKHYGPTPPSKEHPKGRYRGPTIFDHWAGEGE